MHLASSALLPTVTGDTTLTLKLFSSSSSED